MSNSAQILISDKSTDKSLFELFRDGEVFNVEEGCLVQHDNQEWLVMLSWEDAIEAAFDITKSSMKYFNEQRNQEVEPPSNGDILQVIENKGLGYFLAPHDSKTRYVNELSPKIVFAVSDFFNLIEDEEDRIVAFRRF